MQKLSNCSVLTALKFSLVLLCCRHLSPCPDLFAFCLIPFLLHVDVLCAINFLCQCCSSVPAPYLLVVSATLSSTINAAYSLYCTLDFTRWVENLIYNLTLKLLNACVKLRKYFLPFLIAICRNM